MQPVTIRSSRDDKFSEYAYSLLKKKKKIRAYYLAALRTGHFYCATFHSTMPGEHDANAGSRGFVTPGFLGSADGKKRSRPEVEVEVEIEAMRAYSPTPLLSRHRRSLVSAISYLSTVYTSCNKNTFHHRNPCPRASRRSVHISRTHCGE